MKRPILDTAVNAIFRISVVTFVTVCVGLAMCWAWSSNTDGGPQ